MIGPLTPSPNLLVTFGALGARTAFGDPLMLQLIYISTSRADITPATLEDILASSRRNNAGAGVTGLLVAGARRFLQALEGPELAVTTTLKRIGRDPRHFAIVELGRRMVDAREFGSWDMDFQRGTDAAAGAALRDSVDALVANLTSSNLRAQFTGFAALHSKAA